MKANFAIKIMPREVILDTQGRAVEQMLSLQKIDVHSVRVGQWIEVQLEGESEKSLREKAELIAKNLMNPLIQKMEVVKIP